MKRIAFIGIGVMGKSIVTHLLNENYEVTIYTRTKSKALSLLKNGAQWVNTPKEATQKTDIVFSMVGYPQDVEEVYLGESGILAGTKKGQIIIDMTTSSPKLAKEIAERAAVLGVCSIDAPVSGGDVGAKNGTLSIMCGGDEKAFEEIKPILEIFGKDVFYHGLAGAGQHTKMSNQIAIATNMIGVCEAIIYAENANLNPNLVLQSIANGAAGSWSLSNLAPRMLKGDFEPGFYVKHFMKDMDIALIEAENMGIELPGLTLARKMYNDLLTKGYGDKGTQALYKLYK